MKESQDMIRNGLAMFVVVGIAQIVAQELGLYWIWPRFDMPMHFLGGVALGFLALWFIWRFQLSNTFQSKKVLALVGGIVLSLGLGWELFEYIVSNWSGALLQPSLIDTKLDLVLDLLGGYVATLWVMVRYDHEQ